MEILQEKINGIDVLKLKGRLDASGARDLKKKVGAMAKEKSVQFIMDMGAIDFIDSSGLGSIVASLRSVNKMGGDIKISSLQDPVRSIFELTRLHRIFEIFDDSLTAAESFQQKAV